MKQTDVFIEKTKTFESAKFILLKGQIPCKRNLHFEWAFLDLKFKDLSYNLKIK